MVLRFAAAVNVGDEYAALAVQMVVMPAKAGIQYAALFRPITAVSGILGHPPPRV